MDIVVKGRNVEVPEHYRQHVTDKLHKVERYTNKVIRIDVELFHEPNRRQHEHCQRVEITCFARGPVVRAESCAKDFYTALDVAADKLQSRLRRAADRRRVHRGRHTPISVAAATAPLASLPGNLPDGRTPTRAEHRDVALADRPNTDGPNTGGPNTDGPNTNRPNTNRPYSGRPERAAPGSTVGVPGEATVLDEHLPGQVVREKEHPAEPMTVDDALFHMELVGHDFYLFLDKESGRPTVVYRRKGYDYGVLRLAS